MATLYSIDISTGDHAQPLTSGKPRDSLLKLAKTLLALASGHRPGSTTITVRNTGVAATGTVTCAAAAAADTVTINGVAFTAVAGAAGANQFSIDGTDTADAAALAAAINASSTAGISGIVSATSDGAVVTVSCMVPGKVGNAITLASSSGVTLAVSGAKLTGGSESRFTYSL